MQIRQRKSLKKYLEILKKRREYKKAQKQRLSKWQRFKKWSTVDRWIDLLVDIGLIAFDVLSSPILIIVRTARYFLNKYVNKHIKRFLKWFAHKVLKI
jgi:hypothetical protein